MQPVSPSTSSSPYLVVPPSTSSAASAPSTPAVPAPPVAMASSVTVAPTVRVASTTSAKRRRPEMVGRGCVAVVGTVVAGRGAVASGPPVADAPAVCSMIVQGRWLVKNDQHFFWCHK